MEPSLIEIFGTLCFGLAVVHTFMVSKFEHIAHHAPERSMKRHLFHFLGEVEAVFGIWSLIFIIGYVIMHGLMTFDHDHKLVSGALHYLESLNYTEPAFVFVIMCMAGTKPIIVFAEKMIATFAKAIPFPKKMAFYCSALIFGPLLGSFITEPAAMTVTALILLDNFFTKEMSPKFKYATIGLLFVNISIGGTLTHFAAPPVLMVAGKWHWGIKFMMTHFGYKAAISILIATFSIAFMFKNELQGDLGSKDQGTESDIPLWLTVFHLIFIALVVLTAHHMVFFLGLFLFFIGFTTITEKYQEKLKVKESLLVGFFLAGLVTLGTMQAWWLQEILTKLGNVPLYLGSTGLTAITDNAALTYLGSLVELSDSAKYFLVAGAVSGGGLTVIANAPNPAGYGILKGSFGKEGISPLGILKGALFPTALALICFYFLPNLV